MKFFRYFKMFVLIAAIAAPLCFAQTETESVGRIVSLVGTAFVERNGQQIPASSGDAVFLKDKWHTETLSSLEIAFLDDSRIRMASNSVVEITDYLVPERKAYICL
jgi:hypothetical protein